MTEYQPGDVVNGHVFTGTEWVPVRNLELPPAAAVTYPELLPTPGQPWQIGNTQGGKVWTGSSWQPGTGAFYDGKRWQPTFDFVGMREQDAPTAKTQKRNKMVWTWAITALIAVAVMGFVYVSARMPASTRSGSSTSSGTSFSSTRQVVYVVTGTASTVDVTMQAPSGTRQESGVRVPVYPGYTYTMSPGDFVYISAQNRGETGSVSCRILVDGVAVADNTSSGAYVIASCDGRVPY